MPREAPFLVEGWGGFHVFCGAQDGGPWQSMPLASDAFCIAERPFPHPVHCMAMLPLEGGAPLWILWGLWDFLGSSFITTDILVGFLMYVKPTEPWCH